MYLFVSVQDDLMYMVPTTFLNQWIQFIKCV